MTTQSNVPRLGFTYGPWMPPSALREIAVAVEDSGLDELWLWEDCFSQSGTASATAALAYTQRITVAIGLMPVPLRSVAITAMEIATIDGMFPGRFIAGIGHGVQEWMGQAGVRTAKPLSLLREYDSALRALLAGESVTVSGEFVTLDDVKLTWPPAHDIPLMVGGTGPRTLDFAGSRPHGSLLGNAYSDADLQAACDRILAAHAAGPFAANPHAIVYPLIVATGENADERFRAEAPLWGKQPGDQIGVAGDAATIADYLHRLGEMGVTSVAFETTQDVTDQVGFIRFIGEEVLPRLSA